MVGAIGETLAENYTVTYSCGDYATGNPSSGLATTGTPFTPADGSACTSTMQNNAFFAGWAVSGTTDIINPSDGAFTWNYDENKTLTATWTCWPNEDNTECLQGYEITLALRPGDGAWNPPVPDKIYTIYGVGAYVDAARTKKMGVNSGYYITPPSKPKRIISLDTNAPYNPTYLPSLVRRQTNLNSPDTHEVQLTFVRFEWGPLSPDTSYGNQKVEYFRTNAAGYLTAAGEQLAQTYQNGALGGTWYARWSGYQSMRTPLLTGYTFDGWYDNQNGEGNAINYTDENNTAVDLYAKWTANKYNINYNLGNLGHWGSNAVHPDEATYDMPFEVSHPEPNEPNKYTFIGWEIGEMAQNVTHYYSDSPIIVDGAYQSGTSAVRGVKIGNTSAKYFMNLHYNTSGNVQFNAKYNCVNGYGWNSDNTACVRTYNITYQIQNAPDGVSTPNSETVIPGTHTLQDVPTASSPGYTCSKWACSYNSNNIVVDVTVNNDNEITMPEANIGCTSTCGCDTANDWYWDDTNSACVKRPKTIKLSWVYNNQPYDNNPDTCDYGTGTIDNIGHEEIPGWTFIGWKVTDWCPLGASVCGLDANAVNSLSASTTGFYSNDTEYAQNTHTDYWNLNPGEWAIRFSNNGVLKGTAVCTDVVGNPIHNCENRLGMKPRDSFTSESVGKQCWCQMTSYTPYQKEECVTSNSLWIWNGTSTSESVCANKCAFDCTEIIKSSNNDGVRRAIFGVRE